MSFIQPDVSLQPKIWMDSYFTTTKVNCGTDVAMKLKLMVMLMREIMIAAIKLKAMMEKVVAKKGGSSAVYLLEMPNLLWGPDPLSAFAIVSKFFEGFVCWGALWVFFPPTLFNLLPLIGPHQSSKSSALWGLGPLTLNMWFCGSGHRHLLTHSVEIRHCLQLSISETIVTNKKLVAEWKLCILSQWSCRNITVPDKVLGRILAA